MFSWEAFVKEVREKAAEKLAKKPNLDLFLDEGEDREIHLTYMVKPINIMLYVIPGPAVGP